jgi:hypothetical protein
MRGFRHRQNPLLNPRSPRGLFHAVSSFEPFHAPCGIDELLLPGKEGMAGGTDFRTDLWFGGTGLEAVAAQTFHRDILVFGVDSFSHIFLLSGCNAPSVRNYLPQSLKVSTFTILFQDIFLNASC